MSIDTSNNTSSSYSSSDLSKLAGAGGGSGGGAADQIEELQLEEEQLDQELSQSANSLFAAQLSNLMTNPTQTPGVESPQ